MTRRIPGEASVGEPVVGLVLADHHPMFAEGLGIILDAEDNLAVLGVAHTTNRAIELVDAHRPAVLLLDAHLPGGDPAQAVAAVRAASPTKVLMLSADARQQTVEAAVASGADGVLAKHEPSRQLITAIRKLADGKESMVVAPEPVRAGRDPMVAARVGTLTRREWEILGLLAAGWSNRRIASERRLSFLTVRTHVQSLLVKLGVHSKLEAVAFAVEHRLVAAGSGAWDHDGAS
jgi:two-component system, NarL family, nitrate/nitrite response regulator NarL